MPHSWEDAATAKRDSVNALIPAEWRIADPPSRESLPDITGSYLHAFLTPAEVEYTEADATTIAGKIASWEWRSADVTKAFCHRAALVHQLTNCLLEIFFDEGIKQAGELDRYQDTHRKTMGPLHGVPVSLKDQFHLPGVETTMGYVGWIGTFEGEKGTGKERVHESELAKELRACGAVFFCKTSVPHTLMVPETVNNIMGTCWNPQHRLFSCGGSSGGEGALVRARGSPLGFGTDIGGSVRIPAAVNGIYGLKPSTGRLPYEGMANSLDGQNTVLSAVGPLATSFASIRLAMRAALSREPWLHDPLVCELPWRPEHEDAVRALAAGHAGPGRLSLGVVRHNGEVTPHPPVARAVDVAVRALEAQGHEVLDWQGPWPPARLTAVAMAAYTYDGGRDLVGAFGLSGERPAPQLAIFTDATASKAAPSDASPLGALPAEKTASEIARNNVARRRLLKEYMEAWNATAAQTKTGRPLDGIVCPVAPFSAPIPNSYKYINYTNFVNALDYSAAVLPVTTADKAVDAKNAAFSPLSDIDKTVQAMYDPELFHGTPVAVQIIGRRLQEEKTLAVAEVVDEAIRSFGKRAAAK